MIVQTPGSSDIVNASATASNSTLVSVPAGRWFTADVQLSAVQTNAGTAAPSVTWTASGSDFAPASGSTLARIEIGGLLGLTNSDSNTTEIFVYGGDSGGVIGFNASGTVSSCVINGILI
jgi:hypothetical protein